MDPGRPTEPIRPPQNPPQPAYGTTAPLRGPVGPRRRPPVVSWRLIAVGVAIVVGVFLLGFVAGNAGEGDPAAPAPQEKAGAGGRCRKAMTASTELIELQRQALANRTEFTQAALTGDEGAMATLNQELEPLSAQVQEAQSRVNEALEKCRSRGGGKGKGGGKGDGGGG